MPPDVARSGLAGLKVLLVDDNRDAAVTLAKLLQELGCLTDVCFDGAAALAAAEARPPDAVLLDVRLPDMPGTEVCRRLRRLEALGTTSVIALTGATDEATLERVRRAGFDCTLIKPVSLNHVLRALNGTLGGA